MCVSIITEFLQEQSVEIQKSDGSVHGHWCSTTLEAGNPASPGALPGANMCTWLEAPDCITTTK